MARNLIRLSEVISNYEVERDENGYDVYANTRKIRSVAYGLLKEFSVQSNNMAYSAVRLDINTNNNTVSLPNDFLKETFVGLYDENTDRIIPLGKDDNLNIAGDVLLDNNGDALLDSDGIELLSDIQYTGNFNTTWYYDEPFFYNRYYGGGRGLGRQYGLGGGNNVYGYYRFNKQDNRFDLQVNDNITQIILEYKADVTMQEDPLIDTLIEEPLKNGIYFRLIRRLADVPMNEKLRAEKEWFNSRRIFISTKKQFTKQEALQQSRKNTQTGFKG